MLQDNVVIAIFIFLFVFDTDSSCEKWPFAKHCFQVTRGQQSPTCMHMSLGQLHQKDARLLYVTLVKVSAIDSALLQVHGSLVSQFYYVTSVIATLSCYKEKVIIKRRSKRLDKIWSHVTHRYMYHGTYIVIHPYKWQWSSWLWNLANLLWKSTITRSLQSPYKMYRAFDLVPLSLSLALNALRHTLPVTCQIGISKLQKCMKIDWKRGSFYDYCTHGTV